MEAQDQIQQFFLRTQELQERVTLTRFALQSTLNRIEAFNEELRAQNKAISLAQSIMETLKENEELLQVEDTQQRIEQLERAVHSTKKNVEDLLFISSEKKKEIERSHKTRTVALENEIKYNDDEIRELREQFESRKRELYDELQMNQISAAAEREIADRDDLNELNELKRKCRENNNAIDELRAKLADVKHRINNHRSSRNLDLEEINNANGLNYIDLNIDIE